MGTSLQLKIIRTTENKVCQLMFFENFRLTQSGDAKAQPYFFIVISNEQISPKILLPVQMGIESLFTDGLLCQG